MKEKGFAPIMLFLVALILGSSLLIGGSYYMKNKLPINNNPSQVTVPPTTISINEATSPAAPANYIKFNGLCANLAYPNDYKKTNEAIFNTNSPGPSGIDEYGRSLITIAKDEYYFTLDCYPRIKPDFETYFKNTEERLKKYTEYTEKAGYTGQKSSSVEKIKLMGLDALTYTTFADYSNTFLRKGQKYYLGMKGNYVLEITIEWKNIAGNDPNDPTRKELEGLINNIQLIDIFSNRTNLLFAPTLTPTSKPTSTPAPTNIPIQTKFKSSGAMNLENGMTAQVTSADIKDGALAIEITFKNTSSTNQTANLVRLQMHDLRLGTANRENYASSPLAPGESKDFKMSFELLPNPPYQIMYSMPNGSLITFGTYTP